VTKAEEAMLEAEFRFHDAMERLDLILARGARDRQLRQLDRELESACNELTAEAERLGMYESPSMGHGRERE